MGAGIVQILLQAGVKVHLSEVDAGAAEAAKRRVLQGLAKASADEKAPLLDTLVGLPEGLDVDLAVEAIPELIDLKKPVLAKIEKAVRPNTVIATNTSSLSIKTLSESVGDPSRFLGMHFFNPVPRSLLVEIVVADTSPETVQAARDWVALLEKDAIVVRDSPGFATSRLGIAIGLEAIRMVEEGVASVADIDKGMELGYRFPMGPLRLTDLVGLDVRLDIAEHLSKALGERFNPPQLLREKVAAGELGKKSGKGFYEWT
jgi:3-hydroxybutyryl-CoA dehydrogenase